ncbi:MAG: nitronate monooxygenase [Sulfitobacter sp.]
MISKVNLTSILGIRVPIIQAPMIVQKPLVPLAAAVSNAGGLGSLGCAEMSVKELEQRIHEMRVATDKPFNLNFFLHQPPRYDEDLDVKIKSLIAPFYEELGLQLPHDTTPNGLDAFDSERLALLVQEKPAMVSFHFGCPAVDVIDALRSAGIVTAASATTVREALALQSAGIDIVVAQGWEAGGHRGSFETNFEDTGIGTLALVPQIVDAVDVPVVAAGGIADGRGIAAARALGASGVWMGTAFLSCLETPITALHRKSLGAARDEDTHLSRAFSGRPCRAKRTPYSEKMASTRPKLQDFPLMYNYSGPLKRSGIDRDDLNYQFLLYGQAAALNRELTAEQLIARLTAETREVMSGLTW